MNINGLTRAFFVSCAVAAAAACSNNANTNTRNAASPGGMPANPPAAQVAPASNAPASNMKVNSPVSISGCLQEGAHGTYLLTRINEPAHKSVGTAGPADGVQEEQLWLARNEYRIDPAKDVKLKGMLGKQVRISGTLEDRADLPTVQQEENRDMKNKPAGTSGHASNNDKGLDISQGELAKIDATAASVISNSCGNRAPSKTRSGAKSAKPAPSGQHETK